MGKGTEEKSLMRVSVNVFMRSWMNARMCGASTLSRFAALPRPRIHPSSLYRLYAFTLTLLFASSLFLPAADAAPATKTVVIVKQTVPADNIFSKNARARFRAEVVTEKADKHKGLSGRERLPADAGMLFVLGNDSRLFWMKGMSFPIDIIVIDSSMRVTEIFRDLQPCTECPIYRVHESAAYALEINAGLAEKLGIAVGDRFVFGNE